MKAKQILFIAITLILLTSLVFAEENTSTSPTQSNTSTSPVEVCGKIIYFYADNCRYCSGLDVELDKFSSSHSCFEVTKHDIVDFTKMNEDSLAIHYMIDAVPTLVFIDKNNCINNNREGIFTEEQITQWIDNAVCELQDTSTSPASNLIEVNETTSTPQIVGPTETTGPIIIPENSTDNKIICQGCILDNKCYPFGYRKDGNFCSDSGTFTIQLTSDKTCENNFECSTNLCVDNQCIDSGLWQRFLHWFTKLFG